MPIAIVGAGGQGKVVRDLLRTGGQFRVVGFFDRNAGQLPPGESVLGTEEDLIRGWRELGITEAVAAVGSNAIRKRIFQDLLQAGLELPALIHPRATVSPEARIGPGTVVCGHAFIGPGAAIGANCIVNTAANIDHDCILSDSVHVCPGVNMAGGVSVGEGALLGTGANIIPGIRIGAWAIIGAGSAVIRDVPESVTVVGVPARPVNQRGCS